MSKSIVYEVVKYKNYSSFDKGVAFKKEINAKKFIDQYVEDPSSYSIKQRIDDGQAYSSLQDYEKKNPQDVVKKLKIQRDRISNNVVLPFEISLQGILGTKTKLFDKTDIYELRYLVQALKISESSFNFEGDRLRALVYNRYYFFAKIEEYKQLTKLLLKKEKEIEILNEKIEKLQENLDENEIE